MVTFTEEILSGKLLFSRSVVAIILANSQCSLSPMTILLYGVVSVGGTQRLNIAKWAKGSYLHIFCPCLRVLTILWIQDLIRINVDINLVGFTDCYCCWLVRDMMFSFFWYIWKLYQQNKKNWKFSLVFY